MNKKIILSIIALFVMLVFLQSCKKSDAKIVVMNEDLDYIVHVYGGESDFFEPIVGTYPITENDGKLQVTIEFEKIKNTSNKKYYAKDFKLAPSDKDNEAMKVNGKYIEFQAENRNEAAKNLLATKVGDRTSITFSYVPVDDNSKQELLKQIFLYRIELSLEEDKDAESTSSLSFYSNEYDSDYDDNDNDDTEIANSKGSTNWDKVLDDFESYVD